MAPRRHWHLPNPDVTPRVRAVGRAAGEEFTENSSLHAHRRPARGQAGRETPFATTTTKTAHLGTDFHVHEGKQEAWITGNVRRLHEDRKPSRLSERTTQPHEEVRSPPQ